MKPDYTAYSMCRRSWLLAPLITVVVLQGDQVARKLEEYPAHMKVGTVTIGAENLGPSVPTPSGGLFTRDYLTIEVAFFGVGKGQLSTIRHQHFSLRINGAKTPLQPDSPGAVAASIKYPDWEQRRTLESTVGVGDMDVTLGRQRPTSRFPGDHRPDEGTGTGPVPRVENPVNRKPEPTSVDDLVKWAALPEGEVGLPVSGCLYFPYAKKMKTIKTLELIYDGPLGGGSVRIP